MEERIQQIENQIRMLQQSQSISNYDNNLNYLTIRNITDFIECVTVIPTATPKALFDQIKLYSTGGQYRLYVYNYIDNNWRYATLT